jgi:uncharacterized protein YmfQ (DUF2313 family)
LSSEILTSARGTAMLSYCPRYYQASRVFKSSLQASGVELDSLKQGIEEVLDQFFVNTATWGLDLWEQELGLSSFAGKPLDQRRSRAISKIRGMGTVRVALVKSAAESYVRGTIDVADRPELYSFTVKFIDPLGIPPNLDDLKVAIEEIKPAHLEVVYEFTYTTYGQLKAWGLTYGDLAALTYGGVKVYAMNLSWPGPGSSYLGTAYLGAAFLGAHQDGVI